MRCFLDIFDSKKVPLGYFDEFYTRYSLYYYTYYGSINYNKDIGVLYLQRYSHRRCMGLPQHLE